MAAGSCLVDVAQVRRMSWAHNSRVRLVLRRLGSDFLGSDCWSLFNGWYFREMSPNHRILFLFIGVSRLNCFFTLCWLLFDNPLRFWFVDNPFQRFSWRFLGNWYSWALRQGFWSSWSGFTGGRFGRFPRQSSLVCHFHWIRILFLIICKACLIYYYKLVFQKIVNIIKLFDNTREKGEITRNNNNIAISHFSQHFYKHHQIFTASSWFQTINPRIAFNTEMLHASVIHIGKCTTGRRALEIPHRQYAIMCTHGWNFICMALNCQI